MFELSHLRCFVVLAEELHFGRAAERLHMTQPPLSRQVQVLERILGVELFNRTSRRVSLTPAGETFLHQARQIVRLAENAALSARRVWRGEAGRVSIGFTAVSGYDLVPRIVKRAAEAMPGLELQLNELVTGEQLEGLHTGMVDLALVRPPVDRILYESCLLTAEPMVAALPVDDPRLAARIMRPTDFDGQPMIMYSKRGAGYFHDLLAGLFAQAGAAPLYVQYVTQIHSVLGLVRAGLAAAIVPKTAMHLQPDGVTFWPFEAAVAQPVELHMAWMRDSDNAALPEFRKLCLAVANGEG